MILRNVSTLKFISFHFQKEQRSKEELIYLPGVKIFKQKRIFYILLK